LRSIVRRFAAHRAVVLHEIGRAGLSAHDASVARCGPTHSLGACPTSYGAHGTSSHMHPDSRTTASYSDFSSSVVMSPTGASCRCVSRVGSRHRAPCARHACVRRQSNFLLDQRSFQAFFRRCGQQRRSSCACKRAGSSAYGLGWVVDWQQRLQRALVCATVMSNQSGSYSRTGFLKISSQWLSSQAPDSRT
jgi:hypothetical protein